jgi:hypothetical protein
MIIIILIMIGQWYLVQKQKILLGWGIAVKVN